MISYTNRIMPKLKVRHGENKNEQRDQPTLRANRNLLFPTAYSKYQNLPVTSIELIGEQDKNSL